MLRVTFLIPTLDRSGAEKQLVLLATGLPRDRIAPEVIVLTRSGPLEDDLHRADIPVTILGKRGKFDPRTLRTLKKRLRENPPDILHSWLFAANAYGRLATPRRRAFKTVVSERCVDSWKASWQLWLDRRLISCTDALLGNSESVATFYEQQGVPRSLISVIPNAVTPPPRPTTSRAEFLNSLGFTPETKLVGVIGRLAKQKRVDDLLWGMQVLRQAEPTARMLIIGDGPERAHLQQHARDVEVADFVNFLGHRDDAASLIHHLDAFWLGSGFEGMSNSLMEAMAAGTPVIASDIPPNRELITHGVHGYLANVGDGVAFAQYSVKLFQDPALRQSLSTAARDRMQSEFSVPRMIERHAAVYEELAKGAHAQA
ncbi:Putative glycosyltransferase EpsD [Caulifigura coniformis]|uniref:Glycosyltransferase EpsD n=1 Tax=Caulifigura coniformis TaxID=2527983 RepID=A0A517SIS3_9PLAN|nr:glycosyltransferase [Caulifigura coniformis]QDT56025.1 Putative glycosyltransferase EpsD [Caulifigura coniformis]